MRCKVYRSIDASSSLLGLKGSYLLWFIALLGAALFVAVLIGSLTSSIVGTLLCIAGGIASYFTVMVVQARFSEKDIRKFFTALKLHSWIFVKPLRYRSLWN